MPKVSVFALAGAVVIAACAAPIRSVNPTMELSPGASLQTTNVTKLWDQWCAKCHGSNGQGGGAGTQTLLTREKFDQKYDRPFFDAIKNGISSAGMDPFGKTLSDPEVWALVVHIRELQNQGLRQQFGGPKETGGVYTSKYQKYRIETVIPEGKGLATPWAIDWLPDGRMLVTNRPGKMLLFKDGVGTEVANLPESREIGQGGLMDVAVHPDYAKNGWIYLSFTDPATAPGTSGGMTKIVRGKLKFDGPNVSWTGQETVFQANPQTYSGSGIHFGSRIVFDKSGHVFFSIGERGSGNLAQDLTRPNGKIYRVNEDGSIPKDNPFASKADADMGRLGAIWSYGHRNPQGLAMGLDGILWDSEHAPRGGDEVNQIVKGANYGWPIICFGINYNDSPYAVPWPTPEQHFNMPIYRWLPSTGCCGLDVVKGKAFPNWNGDLVAGGLSGANVDRIRTKNGKFVEVEELVYGMGRVREVACGPDGMVYVALNQPDKIIRLAPAGN